MRMVTIWTVAIRVKTFTFKSIETLFNVHSTNFIFFWFHRSSDQDESCPQPQKKELGHLKPVYLKNLFIFLSMVKQPNNCY